MIDPRLARRTLAAELKSYDTERPDMVTILRGYVAETRTEHRRKGKESHA